jgi:hypothetical protein
MSRYQSESQYVDPKQTYLKKATEKKKKMEAYWSTFVKDNKPRVDPNKRE